VKGAPTPVPVPVDDGGILEKGAKGPAVTKVKTLLKKWFDASSPGEWATLKIAPNDVFGESLRKAVRIFQARVGIEIDGQVGTDTMDALKAKPSPLSHASVPELAFPAGLKVGVAQDAVHLLQGWLTLHGFAVVVDGKFLPATQKALQKFQVSRGLPPTGVLDRATWAQLVQPMNAALTPIHGVTPLGGLFVAYAHQHARQKPREVGGENRGPWVRLYTGNEGKDMLWCAGFATFVLKQACSSLGVPMPVRQTLLCDEMATSAGSRFVKGGTTAAIKKLRPGSFFLRRAGPGEGHKYSHCGIIARPEADTMDTIEGNTNDDGSSNGIEVLERTRGYSGMDFIVL
jgi:peptidoglycan hydrolase-like protein with peptidoglycan-binding domain